MDRQLSEQPGDRSRDGLLAEKEREIARKVKEIEALSEISSTVASGRYLDDILKLIVSVTAETMSSRICSVMLYDEKRGVLSIKATQSLSVEYRNKPDIEVDCSISGKAFSEKKPVMVLDVKKEKNYKCPMVAKNENLCSLLSVPMIYKGKAVGVLNSYTTKEHRFTKGETRVLQAIASQAAVAIENAKLAEESRAAKEALESRKAVERAKGLLMRSKRVSEDEAYGLIRKKSMDTSKPMKEVAEAIILTNDINGAHKAR